jgi:capsular exopolysaccharide synthesis family protein
MMPADNSLVLSSKTLQTPLAEAYRALRTNVNFTGIGQGSRALLVTSGGSGEGKSTTVANLGILMAQAGQRVLLVDADFRRPNLHRLVSIAARRAAGVGAFQQKNGADLVPLGLAELVRGTRDFVEVAARVEGFDNLWLIPSGVIPPNPGEILNSPDLRRVIDDLRDRADVVLLDSPPCSVYSDAVELTQVTDGVLYVLRSGPQGLVDHARVLKQLQQGQARLIGIVMNQVERGAGSLYGSYRGGSPASE